MKRFGIFLFAVLYGLGYFFSGKGKNFEQQIKEDNEEQKRQFKRDMDSDDAVRERMREFTRK